MEELSSGYIFDLRMAYHFSNKLSAKYVLQGNNFANELGNQIILSYQPNHLSILYLGITNKFHSNDVLHIRKRKSSEIFCKLQFLIDK